MSQLLCEGGQKLLGEWLALKQPCCRNQNVLPCVRCVGGKLWVSTNHVRYRKNVRLCFVKVLLGTLNRFDTMSINTIALISLCGVDLHSQTYKYFHRM